MEEPLPAMAYLGIKFHLDQRNRAVIERVSAALSEQGMRTECVARDLELWGERSLAPPELMDRTFAVIRQSAVAVIELSEKGVGPGIEAGYAFAQLIPVVVLHAIGSDVSDTLRGIATAVFAYEDDRSLRDAAQRIREIASPGT
jgi:hypothetical protein